MQGRAKEVVNALTEKVIDLMKKHGSQWTKPFANQNFISVNGHEYSGMNFIYYHFSSTKESIWYLSSMAAAWMPSKERK